MPTKVLHSHINEVVDSDEMAWEIVELSRSAYRHGDKAKEFFKLLERHGVGFQVLGVGTNRVGVKINGYCFKFALNLEGLKDTRREMYLAKTLGRDVVMVHEITSDGTLGVYEYVRTLKTEAELHQYYDKIRELLKRISTKFFIGDMGVTLKNARNIGVRNDGTVCSIDFAYIKTVKSTDVQCPYCKAQYQYSENYDYVFCHCRERVEFADIRRRFHDDTDEVNRLCENSYEFNGELEQTVELDPMKSIIQITKEEKDQRKEQLIQARMEERRWKAPEMLAKYRFNMTTGEIIGSKDHPYDPNESRGTVKSW